MKVVINLKGKFIKGDLLYFDGEAFVPYKSNVIDNLKKENEDLKAEIENIKKDIKYLKVE